jgi:peptide/nickel transport system substrate-binding protein
MSLHLSRARRCASALVGVGALALVAACGGSSGGSSTSKSITGTKGGTLYYLAVGDFEHLDPARNYVTDAGDFGRLLYRTLTTYDNKPGLDGTKVVPDLATDLGTPSDNAKTWKFTIKKGIKYEDGVEVTTKDIKYGVERTFSELLPEGAPYIKDALVGGAAYKGPYKDKAGLASIETPDNYTIIFHFTKPFADFRYAGALTTTAPVPAAKDTGVKYDDHPVSSGPYKIDSYSRGKSITFVRNTFWDQKTDKARGAYPDRIEGQLSLDGATIDQRMLADNGPDAASVTFKQVEPENVTKVTTDPAIKARSITGYDNSVSYTAMNTQRGATKDIKVRKAIEVAYPKFAARVAAGGPTVGDFAHSVLVPTLTSHKDFNLYPTDNDKGDPVKAKQMLADAGYPNGVTIKLGVASTATGQKVAAVVKQGLEKAGIKVNLQLIDVSKYYDTIGNPSLQPDLVNYGWIPDWPSASTVIPPLFSCGAIKPQGNNNVANWCDKDFDAKIDQANAETNGTKADAIWAELDKALLENAVIIPRYFGKVLSIHGSSVKNTSPMLAFAGQVDVANVSVK